MLGIGSVIHEIAFENLREKNPICMEKVKVLKVSCQGVRLSEWIRGGRITVDDGNKLNIPVSHEHDK